MDLSELVRSIAASRRIPLSKLATGIEQQELRVVLKGKGTAKHLPLVASVLGLPLGSIQSALLTPVELKSLSQEERTLAAERILECFNPGYVAG